MRLRPALAVLLSATAATAVAVPAHADQGGVPNDKSQYTFALIGDVPYGAEQIAKFPTWIKQINADPAISSVVHVGDIKNGSSVCSDDYFAMIKRDFDTFAKPFVYTPGDNEWTDCHRANNGAYNPLERLDAVRRTFFPQPGRTMGQKQMNVDSQASIGLPENVSYRIKDVSFAAVHVVGSNDATQPWTGLGETTANPTQLAAEKARMNGALALLRQTFADAAKRGDRAVVVMQQADMFDPTYEPTEGDISAFRPYVQELARLSNAFAGQVYLFNGDSHIYDYDQPLAAGSKWLAKYGVTAPVTNLQRVTCDGSGNNKDWLRISITKKGSPNTLSWTRVPYAA